MYLYRVVRQPSARTYYSVQQALRADPELLPFWQGTIIGGSKDHKDADEHML